MLSSLLPSRTLQHDVLALLRQYAHLLPPLTLLISSTLTYIGTPPAHSLFTSALAWTTICIIAPIALRRVGTGREAGGNGGNVRARRLAWAAGGLLTLAKVCEKAVDGRGIWWANVCLEILNAAAMNEDTEFCLRNRASFR
jgi:hypothetical protein